MPKSGALSIVNPPKSQKLAYPICTFTYVIVPVKSSKASTLKQFISWAITGGQKYAPPLQFYPLPNRTPSNAFTNASNWIGLVNEVRHMNQYTVKGDHRISDKPHPARQPA